MFVSYLCVAANSSRLVFVWMCALGPCSCSDGNVIWRGTRALPLTQHASVAPPPHCPNANLLHPWTWLAWWEPQGIITLSEQIKKETLSFPVKRRGCATRHFLPSTISEISPVPCQIKCRLELMISQATFVLSFPCFASFRDDVDISASYQTTLCTSFFFFFSLWQSAVDNQLLT